MSQKFAKNLLITGANRGIGLEFVKKLASRVDILFAGCRKPSEAKELNALKDEHNNIHVVEIDVTCEKSIQFCIEEVSKICGEAGLSCLINNAGAVKKPDNKVTELTLETFNHIFSVNTFGPSIVCKHSLNLLQQAAKTHSEQVITKPLIVNIGSDLSSVSIMDRNMGFYYSYNMSKSSLNMFTKMLSLEIEQDGIDVIAIHPGWVQTDMGGSNAALTVQQSIDMMLETLSNLRQDQNGTLINFKGETIPY